MTTENLALWNAVEKTPPEHTKAITGKAYKGTSPKPHYLIRKATETFGPCGIGWGFVILEEKLMDGALLAPGFNERVHMAHVRVWYEWDGKRGAVEHVGQTVFSGKRKSGDPFTDEDAPKKSVTDALVKALSLLGFAGDIFIGRYDDSKYVADLRREGAAERASEPEPQPNGSEPSKAEYAHECLEIIDGATDITALKKWWDGEKNARVRYRFTQEDVDALKAKVLAKIQELSAPQADTVNAADALADMVEG